MKIHKSFCEGFASGDINNGLQESMKKAKKICKQDCGNNFYEKYLQNVFEKDTKCVKHLVTDFCEINHCKPNPCQNGGQCISGYWDAKCLCKDGYIGDFCQETGPKNAFIIIDVQNDFISGSLALNEGEQVVPVINSFLQDPSVNFDNVVYVMVNLKRKQKIIFKEPKHFSSICIPVIGTL